MIVSPICSLLILHSRNNILVIVKCMFAWTLAWNVNHMFMYRLLLCLALFLTSQNELGEKLDHFVWIKSWQLISLLVVFSVKHSRYDWQHYNFAYFRTWWKVRSFCAFVPAELYQHHHELHTLTTDPTQVVNLCQ